MDGEERYGNNLGLLTIGILGAVAYFSIGREKAEEDAAVRQLEKTLKSGLVDPFTLHPVVDPGKCLGCGTCTKVCPEGDILRLINHISTLVTPTKCVGHGECEAVCPANAITLVFGTKNVGLDMPRLTSNYETNVSGVYIAGELGGMGLIRNAVKQGRAAGEDAVKKLGKGGVKTDTDILIVGAGPAGLAASLAAIAAGKRYICMDQNTLGGVVNNFPRQKVVMSYPAELPIVGKMKFDKNKISKEELLAYWMWVKKKSGLKIKEKTKFQGFEEANGVIQVNTSAGVITTRKLILALGVAGSPRKLGLANEDMSKVTYRLIDPDHYLGKQLVIVGAGNSALEAAQMLAAKKRNNKVIILVRGKAIDRANDENREAVERLAKQGPLEIWFESTVKEIHENRLVIQKKDEEKTVGNDFLFVFAGAERPYGRLKELGITIEKKFGEPLKRSG